MFFRKKVPETAERRKQYRKGQVADGSIRFRLHTPSGDTQAEFIDISVHGAGARFLLEHDPHLQRDDVVELTIESRDHGKVTTPARVVYGQQDGQRHIRYGFEFINIGNLYSQLDSFYARLFNRRGSKRVRPALDSSVTMTLGWRSNITEAQVNEISATGAGVILPMAAAYQLQGIEEVRVSFRLPGLREQFRGSARILNRKTVSDKVLLGLAFDLEDEDGLAALVPRLQKFVDERAKEMERWESSWV